MVSYEDIQESDRKYVKLEGTTFFVNTWEKYSLPRKLFNEAKDCTVRAFAEAFNTTYEKAHSHLRKKMGRVNRKGIDFELGFEDSLQNTKVSKLEFKGRVKNGGRGLREVNRMSLGKFCKEYSKGNYIVLVRGHALTVKDGIVYDYKYAPKRQVKFAFKVGGGD